MNAQCTACNETIDTKTCTACDTGYVTHVTNQCKGENFAIWKVVYVACFEI